MTTSTDEVGGLEGDAMNLQQIVLMVAGCSVGALIAAAVSLWRTAHRSRPHYVRTDSDVHGYTEGFRAASATGAAGGLTAGAMREQARLGSRRLGSASSFAPDAPVQPVVALGSRRSDDWDETALEDSRAFLVHTVG
ncbi:MAG: hypothetical protein J7480_03340 [Microbacteriaceae bacterium]|nr:hypothetical protein [Microbacteriaceae bacterium]